MRLAHGVGLMMLGLAASSDASAGGLGSLLGGSPPRSPPSEALWIVPRLDAAAAAPPPSARPAAPTASPQLAIPGTNGKAALGVEQPSATNPGSRIIIAPSTITTPPRTTRGQSGTVPAFSITIPSR